VRVCCANRRCVHVLGNVNINRGTDSVRVQGKGAMCLVAKTHEHCVR
jgi:hypothetical protein